MTKVLAFPTLLFAVLTVNSVSAQMIPGYPDNVETAFDSREIALLPPYCKHTQLFRAHVPGGDDAQEIERWTASFGHVFRDMHHYCWGLMKTNRALYLARSKQAADFYLASSVHEFDYVLERAPADFALLPEILTKKGANLVRLGKGAPGALELERAIDVKPDYWPPYAVLSDYYKDLGNESKARDILEKGLSASPKARPLLTRLSELRKANGNQKTPGSRGKETR